MAKTKRVGRPVKPARLKRTRRLQLLLTGTELKELKQYAERQHLTTSEVMRACLRALLESQTKEGAL